MAQVSFSDAQIVEYDLSFDISPIAFGKYTTNYEIQLLLKSQDQMLLFPSVCFDIVETVCTYHFSLPIAFINLYEQIEVQIFEIIALEEVVYTSQRVDQASFVSNEETLDFAGLGLRGQLKYKCSEELLQYVCLENFCMELQTQLQLDDVWLEFQTAFMSVRKRYTAGKSISDLILPEDRQFKLKIQYYCKTQSYSEFITLEQIDFESSSCSRNGHPVKITISDKIDNKLLDVVHLIKEEEMNFGFPIDFVAQQFGLSDSNFDDFCRSKHYEQPKCADAKELKSIIHFVLRTTLPSSANRIKYPSVSQFTQTYSNLVGSMIYLSFEQSFDYVVVSQSKSLQPQQVKQRIIQTGLHQYQIDISKEVEPEFLVLAPVNNYNFLQCQPVLVYLSKNSVKQLIQSSSPIQLYFMKGKKSQQVELLLTDYIDELIESCNCGKDFSVKLDGIYIYLYAQQKGILRKNNSVLVSTRFKNISNDTGIFSSVTESFINNYSNTTSTSNCSENYKIMIAADLRQFVFDKNTTHYSAKLQLTYETLIIQADENLNERDERELEFELIVPAFMLEFECNLDLYLLQFDGEDFKPLQEQVFESNYTFNVSSQDKLFEYGQIAIPFQITCQYFSGTAQYIYFYINEFKCAFSEIFMEFHDIPLYCELQSSSFLVRKKIDSADFTLIAPFISGSSHYLLKIEILLQFAAHFEYVELCSFNLAGISSAALSGACVDVTVTDRLNGEAAALLRSILAKQSSGQDFADNYFEQLLGIPQCDNNDISITPQVVIKEPNGPQFETSFSLIAKLANPATYQGIQFLSAYDYLQSCELSDQSIMLYSDRRNSIVMVSLSAKVEGYKKKYTEENQFNYTVPLDFDEKLYFTYQNGQFQQYRESSPLIFPLEKFKQFYVTVIDYSGAIILEEEFNIALFFDAIAMASRDNLDFTIYSDDAMKLEVSVSAKSNKTTLFSVNEQIDSFSEQKEIPQPFTSQEVNLQQYQNGVLSALQAGPYARSRRVYEPQFGKSAACGQQRENSYAIEELTPNYDKIMNSSQQSALIDEYRLHLIDAQLPGLLQYKKEAPNARKVKESIVPHAQVQGGKKPAALRGAQLALPKAITKPVKKDGEKFKKYSEIVRKANGIMNQKKAKNNK